MNKHLPHPTQAEIDGTHFDLTQFVEVPANSEDAQGIEWQVLERGSDAHIAFLEQMLADLQATITELKAIRAKRSS